MYAVIDTNRDGSLRILGDDDMVCDVARQSMARRAAEFNAMENARLIRYLAKHKHISPFHHPTISMRMQAPVPIRTQCFKSKVGFAENEESRRYIKSRPILFVPDSFRAAPAENIKQGSGDTHHNSSYWLYAYQSVANRAIALYERMLEDGVAAEQARFILPQGCEVHWSWTGSIAAFARFHNLRKDPHAQKEIRDLAAQVSEQIKSSGRFPISWAALTGEEA